MLAHNCVQAFGRERDAEQIVGCFRCCFLGRCADPHDFADGGQPGPLVAFLQPVDIGRDRSRSRLDAAMIGVDIWFGHSGLACGIVEIQAHVVGQICLVSLQRQRIVAALFHDLFRDRALAIERVDGYDRPFQRQHFQQLWHGRDLVRLHVGGDLRHHQALLATPSADHVQGRLAAGFVERTAQHFAVYRDNTLTLRRKLRHEALKHGSELIRIKSAKQPAEGVVAGQSVGEFEETAQIGFLRLRKQRHVDGALTTAQNRAKRDDQEFMEIVKSGVPTSRVFQLFRAGRKLLQNRLPKHDSHAPG